MYFVGLLLAILFTSLAYFLGDIFLFHMLSWWQPLIIGASVVLLGAMVEKLQAPMWLIIITPFPVGMFLLLWFMDWNLSKWFYTYCLTLGIYIVLHIVLSALFKFHSLIPAWKLHR